MSSSTSSAVSFTSQSSTCKTTTGKSRTPSSSLSSSPSVPPFYSSSNASNLSNNNHSYSKDITDIETCVTSSTANERLSSNTLSSSSSSYSIVSSSPPIVIVSTSSYEKRVVHSISNNKSQVEVIEEGSTIISNSDFNNHNYRLVNSVGGGSSSNSNRTIKHQNLSWIAVENSNCNNSSSNNHNNKKKNNKNNTKNNNENNISNNNSINKTNINNANIGNIEEKELARIGTSEQIAIDTLADIAASISGNSSSQGSFISKTKSCRRRSSSFKGDEGITTTTMNEMDHSADSNHHQHEEDKKEEVKQEAYQKPHSNVQQQDDENRRGSTTSMNNNNNNNNNNKVSVGIGTDTILIPSSSTSLQSFADLSLNQVRDKYYNATEAAIKAVVDAIEKQQQLYSSESTTALSLIDQQNNSTNSINNCTKKVELDDGKQKVAGDTKNSINHDDNNIDLITSSIPTSSTMSTETSMQNSSSSSFRKIHIKLGVPSLRQFISKHEQNVANINDLSLLSSVLMKVDEVLLLHEVNLHFWEKITLSCPPFYRKLFTFEQQQQKDVLPPATIEIDIGGLIISQTKQQELKEGNDNNEIEYSLNTFAVIACVVLEEEVVVVEGIHNNDHGKIVDSELMMGFGNNPSSHTTQSHTDPISKASTTMTPTRAAIAVHDYRSSIGTTHNKEDESKVDSDVVIGVNQDVQQESSRSSIPIHQKEHVLPNVEQQHQHDRASIPDKSETLLPGMNAVSVAQSISTKETTVLENRSFTNKTEQHHKGGGGGEIIGDDKNDTSQYLASSNSISHPTTDDDREKMMLMMMMILKNQQNEQQQQETFHQLQQQLPVQQQQQQQQPVQQSPSRITTPIMKKDPPPTIRHGFTISSNDYVPTLPMSNTNVAGIDITERKTDDNNNMNRKRKADTIGDRRNDDESHRNLLTAATTTTTSHSSSNNSKASSEFALNEKPSSLPTSCSMDLLASISSEIHAQQQQQQQQQETLLLWDTLRQLQQNNIVQIPSNNKQEVNQLESFKTQGNTNVVVARNKNSSSETKSNNRNIQSRDSNYESYSTTYGGHQNASATGQQPIVGNSYDQHVKTYLDEHDPSGGDLLDSNISPLMRYNYKKLPAGTTNKKHKRLFVQHSYRDYSDEEPFIPDDVVATEGYSNMSNIDEVANREKGGLPAPMAFPSKLHETLSRIEQDGYDNIIGWLPHGRSFKIFKQKEFTEIILTKYFVMTKKSSFLRQLNLYGFHRISTGGSYSASNKPRKNTIQDQNSYYHEKFLRGIPHLCLQMKRQKVNGNKIRSAGNPDQEPDFSLYPSCPPEEENEEDEESRLLAVEKTSSPQNVPIVIDSWTTIKSETHSSSRTSVESRSLEATPVTSTIAAGKTMPAASSTPSLERRSSGQDPSLLSSSKNMTFEIPQAANIPQGQNRNDNNNHSSSLDVKPQSNPEMYERTFANAFMNRIYQMPVIQSHNHNLTTTTSDVNPFIQPHVLYSLITTTTKATTPITSSENTLSSQDLMTSHRLLLLASQLLKVSNNSNNDVSMATSKQQNDFAPQPVHVDDNSRRVFDTSKEDNVMSNSKPSDLTSATAVHPQYSSKKRKLPFGGKDAGTTDAMQTPMMSSSVASSPQFITPTENRHPSSLLSQEESFTSSITENTASQQQRTNDDALAIDNTNAGASNFPWKLQRILDKLELEGKTDIISWLDHGRAFIVKNSHRFLTELMPLYFSQTKYSSFQRQLHMYNFERITSAKNIDKGAYHHPNFLRGLPDRAFLMQRTRVNGKGTRQPGNPAKEPNFYILPSIPQLAVGTIIEDIPMFSVSSNSGSSSSNNAAVTTTNLNKSGDDYNNDSDV